MDYVYIKYRKKATRCYRCLRTGHISRVCGDENDRRETCFNCGGKDHGAANCNKEAYCLICDDLGKEANHRVGSSNCTYLTFPVRRMGGNVVGRRMNSYRSGKTEEGDRRPSFQQEKQDEIRNNNDR